MQHAAEHTHQPVQRAAAEGAYTQGVKSLPAVPVPRLGEPGKSRSQPSEAKQNNIPAVTQMMRQDAPTGTVPRAVIQRFELEDRYTFETISNVFTYKGGSVYGFTATIAGVSSPPSRNFVVKKDANQREADNTRIARLGNIAAPDMRQLSSSEVTPLREADIPASAGWWLMSKVEGQTLLALSSEEDNSEEEKKSDGFDFGSPIRKMRPLSEDQWINIGRTAAHQVFVLAFDRWQLDIATISRGSDFRTRFNKENTIIQPDDTIAVIDSPSVHYDEVLQSTLSAKVTPYVQRIVSEADGATLVNDVWTNGLAEIVTDDRRINKGALMRQGFLDFMQRLVNANLSGMNRQYTDMQEVVRLALNPPKPKKKRGIKCYLTTACTEFMGLPDNCEELTVLRDFRDNYLASRADGELLIRRYYERAPAIVRAIHRRRDRDEILAEIYVVICDCVTAIKSGDNQSAFDTYCTMTLALDKRMLHKAKSKRQPHPDF